MSRKKEKTDIEIEEETLFLVSIKNLIPDYDYRVKEVYRLYNQAKEEKIKKVSWDTLVGSQGPGTNQVSESDWKRFVSLYRSHKKNSAPPIQTIQEKQMEQKKEIPVQGSLFPNTFKTKGY